MQNWGIQSTSLSLFPARLRYRGRGPHPTPPQPLPGEAVHRQPLPFPPVRAAVLHAAGCQVSEKRTRKITKAHSRNLLTFILNTSVTKENVVPPLSDDIQLSVQEYKEKLYELIQQYKSSSKKGHQQQQPPKGGKRDY